MIVMEPALQILDQALQGEEGARSFLDRTSSIYILDATDITKPKTYGCWNFIHQAINEVERVEAQGVAKLVPHVQLLATMALRVARRSNEMDKNLVETCIENAAKYHGSANEALKLVEINVEIRDIVMGRIAALALDPSFHRHTSSSAFSNAVVMEQLCAVLAANAVSNGPAAVNHLVSEWIVPSAGNLPRYCLASVTLHLALEASRKATPVNTPDMLQRLSNIVMSGVLAPVLAEAVRESSTTSNSDNVNNGVSTHEWNNRIAALSLKAIDRWCSVTDLSLAQIKHVCSKVQINIVDILSDAMYSDSGLVVDALAGLIEAVVERHQAPTVSDERMTQVRYIMQVDEVSFRSNITKEHLVTIESKEMAAILEELVSAIGLQRFRFLDRQKNGDDDVCRSLARIAASICTACTKLSSQGQAIRAGPGLLDLLMKAASHPSVNICGVSIDVLADLAASETGISNQLLPVLQRRAITPHHFINGAPSIIASDTCGASFQEFELFRDTTLYTALVATYKSNEENYMASCTSAIEEFCAPSSGVEVSFHLEAVLFCVGAVADEVIAGIENSSSPSGYLERCAAALASKPSSLMGNPLTLSQACRFLRKYDKWFSSNQVEGVLHVATDIALSTFCLCASDFPDSAASLEMKREAGVSPYKEAAKALQDLLCHSPQQFLSNQAIAALGAGWEASYTATNRSGVLSVGDRKAVCVGLCHVLAALPDSQRAKSLLALAMPTLDCLETMIHHASDASRNGHTESLDVILKRISSEIIVLTTMARAFTDAFSENDSSMGSGCRTSDGHAAIVEPALALIQRAWPSVARVASTYNHHDSISQSLGYFLTQCLPPECNDDFSVSFIKELCAIATSMIGESSDANFNSQSVIDFLQSFVKVHGDSIDKDARSSLEGRTTPSNAERGREVGRCLEALLLATIAAVNNMLGSAWRSSQRQGQGQPPFESKAEPVEERRLTSNLALPGIFTLLKTCAERCPVFLLHLPSSSASDRNEDLLLRRAVESAAASLVEPDVATSKSAMEFVEATVVLTHSASEDVRHIAEDILAHVRTNILSTLVMGACGNFNSATLGPASRVLLKVLASRVCTEEELQNTLSQALGVENFHLGPTARNMTFRVMQKGRAREISEEDMVAFLHDLWELHQVESFDALAGSDSVAKFCQKTNRLVS